MNEWTTAKSAFEKSQELSPSSTTERWIRKCVAEIEAEGDDDEEEVKEEMSSDNAKKEDVVTIEEKKEEEKDSTPLVPQPTKVRWQWYQSVSSAYISIFLKNKNQEDVNVEFGKDKCDIKVTLDDGEVWKLNIVPFADIVPTACKIDYGKVKIEVTLRKAEDAQWDELQRVNGATTRPWADETTMNKHVYPSSSKKKVDFDSLEVEEDKLEGDAALNKVFQDIFSNASDEQRKAMQKSFLESGGTVLSTNWDEVGKGEVKGTPPKGMEMHKWSE